MHKCDRDWENLERQIVTCRKCPRLVAWREEVAQKKRRAFQEWTYWGKPVPGFGDRDARLLLLGLAPGAHGSNRTSRMFTGDSSGDTLFAALYRAGYANQPHAESRYDSLVLTDVFITAVGRCVPPKNKPMPVELNACQPFLEQELLLLNRVKVVLALGKIAFDRYLGLIRQQGHDVPKTKFGHGVWVNLGDNTPVLGASYHPSRQNTQTGRLTEAMFDRVIAEAKAQT
ncbi:MAG: uracil-DNA glycosylase [Anaerolineae bacterium]|nr:uracil-DNA glycosylase [Anaerolineae bacterium]